MRTLVRVSAVATLGAAALLAAPSGTATAVVDPSCESGNSNLSCTAFASPGPLTWTVVLVWPDNSRTPLTYQTAGRSLFVPCNPRQTNLVSYTYVGSDGSAGTSPTRSIRCNAGGWP